MQTLYVIGFIISYIPHYASMAEDWMDLHQEDFSSVMIWIFWLICAISFAISIHPFRGFWQFVGWIILSMIAGALFGLAACIPYLIVKCLFKIVGLISPLYYVCEPHVLKNKQNQKKQNYESQKEESRTENQRNENQFDYEKIYKNSQQQNSPKAKPDLNAAIALHADNKKCHLKFK